MSEWIAESDWSKVQIGDRVQVRRAGDVLTGEASGDPFLIGFAGANQTSVATAAPC